ncbi:MAG TPA: MCE family protein [Jatrophihabitantaceae bacterium]
MTSSSRTGRRRSAQLTLKLADGLRRLRGWMTPLRWVIAAGTAAALVAAAVLVALYFAGGPTQTIRAQFASTPGLYANNAVDILGVHTGTVTSVRPGPGYVEVSMSLPAHVKIPADARAIIMAPNPVSDYTVELYPPYTGGALLPPGSVIPVARTAAPLGVDQIFSDVDALAKALGPQGANQNGSLSDALHALARITSGNGQKLQNTLAALAGALPALTADPNELSDLITNLDKLSGTLAAHNETIDAFLGDVSTATSELADERGTLAAAITNLQQGLSQVAAFLRSNQNNITSTTSQLATTSQALVADQKALMQTFNTAALGFQNFNNTIDVNSPCVAGEGAKTCPIIFGRLDLPQGVASVLQTYCPTPAASGVRIVLHSLPGLAKVKGLGAIGNASTIDSLCFSTAAMMQGHNGTPGAPQSPNLGLQEFLK